MNPDETEKDYETYKQLIELWARENPIKTHKLQMLLLANTLLFAAVSLNGGFAAQNWPIYLAGTLSCLVWTLSIGRTSLFQEIWQSKLTLLADRYPEDTRFGVHRRPGKTANISLFLRLTGGVSSRYYLIGTPIVFGLVWLIMLVYSLFV